jgi:bacterioferritin
MASKELLELLNKAVERELQVSVQYFLQHAKMEKIARRVKPENILLDKTTYDAIGAELKVFSIEEMKHLGAIMERIYILGGKATTKSTKPKIGKNLKEFVTFGYEDEKGALELYGKILSQAKKENDWETFKLFQEIYSDEEKHLLWFEEYLKIDIKEPDMPEPPEAKFTKIYTDEYFALLNKALAAEISAIIQYTNQHEKASQIKLRKKDSSLEIITDSNKAQVVSDMLKEIFLEEMQHMEDIAERIYLLGGECIYNPDPLPKVGETIEEFILNDREGEDYAIVLYRQIVKKANELGDTVTKDLFESIIADEERHFWMFDDFL